MRRKNSVRPGKKRSVVIEYSDDNYRPDHLTNEQRKAGMKNGEGRFKPSYWPFVIPALVIVGAVIIFPWVFTLWMSVNEWHLGGEKSFVGFANFARLAGDQRFWQSMGHTVLYTVLSVVAPAVFRHDRGPCL